MAENLKKGDEVSWSTSQGETHGTVVAVRTSDFSIEGTDLRASKDDPRVEVRSDKTGKHAGHRPSALKRR